MLVVLEERRMLVSLDWDVFNSPQTCVLEIHRSRTWCSWSHFFLLNTYTVSVKMETALPCSPSLNSEDYFSAYWTIFCHSLIHCSAHCSKGRSLSCTRAKWMQRCSLGCLRESTFLFFFFFSLNNSNDYWKEKCFEFLHPYSTQQTLFQPYLSAQVAQVAPGQHQGPVTVQQDFVDFLCQVKPFFSELLPFVFLKDLKLINHHWFRTRSMALVPVK